MPETPDDQLYAGRYHISALLGKGERKRTYLAWDTKVHRQVALAVVAPDSDPEVTRREVEMLGRVGPQDNIVTLYDYDVEPGRQYLVFEYLPGGELRAHLNELKAAGQRMPLPEFFRLARQLCRALGQAHEHGVIHRDVSTTNIWLGERGAAHIGDFDTAVTFGEPLPAGGASSTVEGYAAPELRSGAPIDGRADLYALGAVLYEALVGTAPVLLPDADVPADPPSKFREDVPAGLDRLILSMLAPDAQRRPASASVVLQMLRDIEDRAAKLGELIADGESDTVEFKSSLRTDVPGGGLNKALERVIIKSVTGFLNGRGGTLLVGIADDGTPLGLEADYRSSPKIGGRDGFERKLRELISNALGASVQQFMTVTFHDIDCHDVCRVAVEPSDHPVYAKEDGKTKFFLRTGNATNELAVDEAIRYYAARWSPAQVFPSGSRGQREQ